MVNRRRWIYSFLYEANICDLSVFRFKNPEFPYEEIMRTIQMAFSQQSVLESCRGMLQSINNKTNITLRFRVVWKNKININLQNVHFVCSIDVFKVRNNRVSNQNLSETAQNPARFFENNTLAHSVKAVPGKMRKKDRKLKKNICLRTHQHIQTVPRHDEARGETSL